MPNCVAYDPTYAYELAVIVQDGLRRMYQEQENVFYYITCMNENYAHPAMPAGVAQGILNGMYLLQIGGRGKVRVTLFGSGTILREVLAAAEILGKELRRACRRVFGHQLQRAAQERAGRSNGATCCIRTSRASRLTFSRPWRIARVRSSPPPTT